MKNPELDALISQLETRHDLTFADLQGVAGALTFLLPETVTPDPLLAERLHSADEAMHIADHAYPNWSVHIRGRANDTDGHWHCTLRESDKTDDDSYIGSGRSPILGQAILAAVLRLTMMIKR